MSRKEEILYTESGGTLAQAAERSCDVLSLE